MTIFTRTFVRASAERALKTFAQAAVALLGVDTFGLLDVDWVAVASAAGLAALLSVLTSVASAPVGEPGPSLGAETVYVPRHAASEPDAEPVEPDPPIVTSGGPEWPEGDR